MGCIRVGIKERGEFIAFVRGLCEREIGGEGDGFARVKFDATIIFFETRRAEKMKCKHGKLEIRDWRFDVIMKRETSNVKPPTSNFRNAFRNAARTVKG